MCFASIVAAPVLVVVTKQYVYSTYILNGLKGGVTFGQEEGSSKEETITRKNKIVKQAPLFLFT
jgi:hypothetical protein